MTASRILEASPICMPEEERAVQLKHIFTNVSVLAPGRKGVVTIPQTLPRLIYQLRF